MDVYTATTAIAAPPDTVFDYLAIPENQPEWAISFIKATKPVGDGIYVMETPVGEITYRIDVDPVRRVVDLIMHTPGGDMILPSRVVPLAGGSLVTFTIVRGPDQPDDAWRDGQRGIDGELEVLRTILERAAA